MSNQIIPMPSTAITAIPDAEFLKRLKLMIVGGKNYTDQEASALMVYSKMTGMNPFLNECYYMANVGPYPGIAFYRRRAQEQILDEAKLRGEPWAQTNEEYFFITDADAGINLKPGYIACKCVLKDTLSSKYWRKQLFESMDEFKKLGETDYYKIALQLVGEEPHWDGIGIVTEDENFGKDRMVRLERAQKRALKMAIKKRFTQIVIPEPAGADVEPSDYSISIETPAQMQLAESSEPKQTQAEILSDLGYDADPSTKIRTIPQPIEPMTIETALEVTTNKGHRYGDFSSDELFDLHNIIERELTANGIDQGKRNDLTFRRDAIRTIWHKEPANG